MGNHDSTDEFSRKAKFILAISTVSIAIISVFFSVSLWLSNNYVLPAHDDILNENKLSNLLILVNLLFAAIALVWFFILANTCVLKRRTDFVPDASKDHFETMSRYDPLTGLLNRISFQENLKDSIHSANQQNRYIALLYIDMDKFKDVNDTLGHEAGDLLLQLVAKRLSACCQKSDILARLGGDEFAVIVNEFKDSSVVSAIAERLIHQLKAPFILHGNKAHISLSIGIAIYCPEKNITLNKLVQYADLALYKAKSDGRDCYRFFTKQLDDQVKRRVMIEDELRTAVENEEITCSYQPKIDATNNTIVGVEALIRWHNKKLGQVSPDEFIPIAEGSNLILKIGEYMIRTVCHQVNLWSHLSPTVMKDFKISLNISAVQLDEGSFVDTLIHAAKKCAIPCENIVLEITETALVKNPENARDILHRLKNVGFIISLDDFGTGYSSLTLLKRLPIDELKIDRSFIRGIVNDNEAAILVKGIVALSSMLGIYVTAEGVEEKEQVDYLLSIGCKTIQGYYYSKPMTVVDMTRSLEEQCQHQNTQHYFHIDHLRYQLQAVSINMSSDQFLEA